MEVKKVKKPTPSERWGQLLTGRLTDKQIFDLFDEFGMAKRLQAKDDYEWVRNNLPNKPEEIQKILKIEIDKENAARKEAAKPKEVEPIVNKEAPSSQEPNTGAPSTESNDGEGGPVQAVGTPIPTTNTSYATSPWTTSKDSSLVKFNADPNGADPGDASTVWWVDHSTKTMRPIMSMQALRDLYPEDSHYQAALNSITMLTPEELTSGQLKGFTDLGVDYGIFERQQAKKLDFNPSDLKGSYGQTKTEASDINGIKSLNSFISILSNPSSGIDPTFLDKIKNDKITMALYMNGLAYGGYTPDDIYKDIKRKELVEKGDTTMNDVAVISSNINKTQYAATNPGRYASSLPSLTPPASIGNISREVWDSPAAQLSDEYYKLAEPETYDPTSQAFKDQLEKIKPEFYDYVLQSLSATKESDKIIADKNWKDYKTELEKTYGYKFSDNALAAWRQLEKLDASNAEAGLSGSGIANEQIDQTLRDYRTTNDRLREEAAKTTSTKEAEQARASYSPDQIQAMNEEDKAKGLPREQWRAYQWGLMPKNEVTLQSFIAEFRANHPEKTTVTDDEIKKNYYDNLYDQYGNLRSKLYQNYQDNLSKTTLGYSLNSIPGTSLKQEQINTYAQNQLDKESAQQKDAATLESGNAFNPLKGEAPIDYGIKTDTPAVTTTATPFTDPNEAAVQAAAAKERAALASKTLSNAPAGMTKIPSPAEIKNYSNVTKPTATDKSLYGIPNKIAPAATKYATQWDPTKGATSKKVMKVGDAFDKGYSLYTGK